MELTEEKVYEVLGVKPQEAESGPETGGKERENAAPAGAGTSGQEMEAGTKPEGAGDTGLDAGGKEREAAEPAGARTSGEEPEDGEAGDFGEPETGDSEAAESAGKPEAEAPKPTEMTPEQRREAAAKRRRAEQQAAIDRAVEEAVQAERERAKERSAVFFKRAKLKNTVTGKEIASLEDFDDWERDYAASKLQKELQEGKLSRESLDAAIAENPEVKRARELVQKQEEAARAAEAQAAQARVEAELQEIRKLDPSIRSVEDLLHMPEAREFYGLVQKGNSFLDAFRLASFERLRAKTAEAARQEARNLARSKDHLKDPAMQRGGGAVSVPPDELRLFRELNPGAKEADIQAYYNRYKQKER